MSDREGGGLDALAEALQELHTKRTGRPARLRPEPAGGEREALYRDALRHFTREEERLRAASSVADALLGRLRRDAGTPSQRVVPLRVAAGGVAGGRVLVENDTGEPARLELVARFALPCAFRPPVLDLDPGQVAAVDVRLDLAGAPFAPGEVACLCVDVCASGAVRAKVWLDIRIDEGGE